MKKLLKVAGIPLTLSILLAGCGDASSDSVETAQTEKESNEFVKVIIDKHLSLLIHKETGVQYLKLSLNSSFDGGVAITPLLQADGKPYIGENIKSSRFTISKINNLNRILRDHETGVQYLMIFNSSSYEDGVELEPLLDSDGNLFIKDKKDTTK